MDEKEIREKGYHEFSKTPLDNDGIEKRFQKRFDDENGKRYFINISKWKEFVHPHTGDVFPVNYEFNIQMYERKTHNPVNMLFFSGWEIDSVEKLAEWLFESGKFDYYEKNDGTREGQ